MSELMTDGRVAGSWTARVEVREWPTDLVDVFLDEVQLMVAAVAGWSETTWALLGVVAAADAAAAGAEDVAETEARTRARERAEHQAWLGGRGPQWQHADRSLTAAAPSWAEPEAVRVLRDALLAMVTGDLLMDDDRWALTRRLAAVELVLPGVVMPAGARVARPGESYPTVPDTE